MRGNRTRAGEKAPKESGRGRRLLTGAACLALCVLLPLTARAAEGDVEVNETNFPDAVFRQYILDQYDTSKNGVLETGEIAKITYLDMGKKGITDLKGIEFFKELTYLYCSNNEITELDLSGNTALTEVHCSYNKLEKVNVAGNAALKKLNCDHNSISELRTGGLTALTKLNCSFNNIVQLDISDSALLAELTCSWNSIKELDISANTALRYLDCTGNEIEKLDTGAHAELDSIYCGGNLLTELDLGNNGKLEALICAANRLTALDVSQNGNLREIGCDENQLTELDLSHNPELRRLVCGENRLTELDLSHNTKLTGLHCDQNQLTALDISKTAVRDSDFVCNTQTRNIVLRADGTLDLTQLSAEFDADKAYKWSGATVEGNILTADQSVLEAITDAETEAEITYRYKLKETGSTTSMYVTLLPTHIHAGELVEAKPATCREEGMEAYYHCACGKDFSDGNCGQEIGDLAKLVLPKQEHSYDEGVVTKAASCTEKGEKKYTCTFCQEEMTEEIPEIGHHSYDGGVVKKEATCAAAGEKIYTCSVCRDEKREEIPKTDHHSYDGGVVKKEATCTATGEKIYTCSVCHAVRSEKIEKKEHSYRQTVQKATIGMDGRITYICSICGASGEDSIVLYPAKITLDRTVFTYDGKNKKPVVTVADINGKTISADNYTVSYGSGRKKVGQYTVKVTFKGNYSGTKNLKFRINPANTEVKSLTAQSKGVTVKWRKRTAEVTGYQIQYSTDSRFTDKKTKTVTVKDNKSTSRKLTGLKAKKKYYVRIRTYKTVSKTKYYSEWSKAKKVTTGK